MIMPFQGRWNKRSIEIAWLGRLVSGRTLGLALGLVLALVLTGCQGAPVSETEGGDASQVGSTAAPAAVLPSSTSTKLQAPKYIFGIIYPMAHPFYEEVTRLAEEAGSPENVRLVVRAPDAVSVEQQIHMMETMIQQQVDGIAISPIDSGALTPVINKAEDAGIPVICFESDAPDSRRSAYIGTNNVEAGAEMGRVIQKRMKDKGMVLVASGVSSMSQNQDRLQGLLDFLHDKTNIQVLEVRHNEGDDGKALIDLEAMIDAHPHFDAFISVDLTSSSASVLVWKAMGLSRYAVAFHMTPEMKEGLRNGQITSVLSQNEEGWGGLLVGQLLRLARGEPVPAFTDTGRTVIDGSSEALTSKPK
ncbi:substrate-binding domain-containing protein [Paenibacillus sp. MBLB2552]|uniref:Substrate-binding domain-containing protein n=1 Tax=Paenibacillus mellifer TaxID=2937794 RepID=A0A9X1Y257_9BACL|nr:substrate-binding domain-containing protein [Paenibacillus mellifer]MCK8489564.1 substrate-binding domain-containing protein [Paenibacillus mellifer]